MAEPKLPPTFAVQMFTEAPQQVRAHAVGDLVSLTFGDDLSGVRFMGRRDDLWHLIGQAGRALHDVTDDPEHG